MSFSACRAAGCYWLLEGEGDGRAEQLEGAALDGRGIGEFLDALSGEADGLAVERGQVLEQVAVAVGGQAAGGVLGGVLGFGPGGAPGGGDRVCGGGDVLVGEGELGEGGAQVPGEVAGEHADQHVAADPLGEVVVDGAQVQVVGLGYAEVPPGVLEVFVGGDRSGGVEDVRGDAGADHVDPVEGSLGGDLLLVAAPGEGGAGDLGDEVLADLVLADHLPDPYPDLVRVLQPPGGHRRPDLGEIGLGGGEQVLALAGPLGPEHGVLAADQPFAGVVGVGDLGEVTDVEQAHLQRPVITGQRGDGGRLQRGDPVHALALAQVADPGAGDHPPVADHDQGLDAEVPANAGDGGLERFGVGGVAREHPDGDRAAFGIGEQPVFDLLAAALAVPGVPEGGQLAA